MHTQDRFRLRALALAAAGALLASTAATAADSARQAQYEKDVAACNSGTTGQNRADCLREAGAVATESRQDSQASTPQERMRNATQRCEHLPAADRQTCMETMTSSQTKVQGTVGGGGVLRERTIPVPASSVPAQGAATPPASGATTMPAPMPGTAQPAPGASLPPAGSMPSSGPTPLPPPPAPAAPAAPMGSPGAPGTNVR